MVIWKMFSSLDFEASCGKSVLPTLLSKGVILCDVVFDKLLGGWVMQVT